MRSSFIHKSFPLFHNALQKIYFSKFMFNNKLINFNKRLYKILIYDTILITNKLDKNKISYLKILWITL